MSLVQSCRYSRAKADERWGALQALVPTDLRLEGGWLSGQSDGLVIDRSRVRVPAEQQQTKNTPLTHRSLNGLTMLSRHSVGNHQGNELTRNPPGNARPYKSVSVRNHRGLILGVKD